MNCQDYIEAWTAQMAGTRDESPDMAGHAAQCATCLAHRGALEAALRAIAQQPRVTAPAGFAAHTWTRIQSQKAGWERSSSRTAEARSGSLASRLAAALASLASLGPIPVLAGGAAALALALVLVVPGRAPVAPISSKAPTLASIVTVHAGPNSALLPLADGSTRIALDAGQHLALSHEDGASLSLDGPARLTLDRGGRARLDLGRVIFDVAHRTDATSYQVSTPDATIGVVGTHFTVCVGVPPAGDHTYVLVGSGAVSVASGAATCVARPGESVVATGHSLEAAPGERSPAGVETTAAVETRPPIHEVISPASGAPARPTATGEPVSGVTASGTDSKALPATGRGATLTNPFNSNQTRSPGRE